MKRTLIMRPALALVIASTCLLAGAQAQVPVELDLPTAGEIQQQRQTYIVVLQEPPLATYEGTQPGLAAPDRTAGRLAPAGQNSQAYVQHLATAQDAFINGVGQRFGRSVEAKFRYQHALNGVALVLSPIEAAQIETLPEVRFVERPRLYQLDTDVGPFLIGADGIWGGTATGGLPSTRGEGVVVGVIDSGINSDHPSFAAMDGDGFTHTNPLGTGNFLGYCADNAGFCNDKLIGAYDFVFDLVSGDANADEEPEPEDNNAHGSHTAGTAAGNVMISNFEGVDPQVSGVAPRANIIAYDVCYTRVSDGRGLCPNAATVASINQAVADGIVDVINYSISGGTQPWDESTSLAFLAAVDAGIFVSASAGNSGPSAATLGHLEPWVASVAASTHGRFFADAEVDATGGDTGVGATEGTGPVTLGAALSDEIRFNQANSEGCTASGGFPAGFFEDGGDGTIALIARGTCGFAEKVDNAAAAGARAAIIYNNRVGTPFAMGALDATSIPAVMISQSPGESIRDDVVGGTVTMATITPQSPAVTTTDAASADVVASFSSRGPGSVNILKPDVAAPGVSILAPFQNGAPGGAPEFGLLQGTSMAAPHNAGAAALLRALYPAWSVSEIKSALVLTANSNMMADTGADVLASTPFDRGAGRVDLSIAAQTGLVMNELSTNFLLADPDNGGDPSALNLPSMSEADCIVDCSWDRALRSVASGSIDWTATFVGDGEMTGTVTPANFTLLPGQNIELAISADMSAATADAWHFGTVELTPTTGPTLHMPVSAFAVGARMDTDVAALSATLAPDAQTTDAVVVSNDGGADLNLLVDASNPVTTELLDQGTSNSGFRSRINTAGAESVLADDIVLPFDATLNRIVADGFPSIGPLGPSLIGVELYVWADEGGFPAGDPFFVDNALLTLSLSPGDPGLDTTDDVMSFDLTAAGATLPLAAGRYWVGVLVLQTTASQWNWLFGSESNGLGGVILAPEFGINAWSRFSAFFGVDSLALAAEGEVTCGASFISPDPTLDTITPGGDTTVTATFDSTGFTRGDYLAAQCLEANDSTAPLVVLPVTMTVQNSVPVAVDDAVTVDEAGTGTVLDSTDDSVLDNDSDLDGDSLTVSGTLVSEPANGSVTVNGDGTFSYTHDGSETMSDSFAYEACDNAPTPACDSATVNITVDPVNDAPQAVDEQIVVSEGGLVSNLDGGGTSVLANDTDAEGDDLAATTTPVSDVANGVLTLATDGTFSYTHDGSESTADSFTYEVCDDGTPSECGTATVTITVTAVNDAPVAVDDALSVDSSGTVTMTSGGDASLTANDTDAEAGLLTVNTTPVTAPSAGSLTLNADGTFSYTHDGSPVLMDQFTYEVCDDGVPQQCDTATVTIGIGNSTPVAVDDEFDMTVEAVLNESVATNDSDPDMDDLSYSTVSGPDNGSLTLNADGTFEYTPNPGFEGADTFTYEVTDQIFTDQATVTIRIGESIFSSSFEAM